MTELEKAIARLQQKTETMQKQIDELTAREQARRISEGLDAPHHIGKKTREVLLQEAFSLLNTKPAQRPEDFETQMLNIWNELIALVGKPESDKAMKTLYRELHDREQHIVDQIKEFH